MKLLNYLRILKKKRMFRNLTTLKGSNYFWGMQSGVSLCHSTKEDIILENHVRVEGFLSSQYHGKIVLKEYVKIGAGSKILAVEKIEIGAYTAIAENTTITDNNTHPVSPIYRRFMREMPRGDYSRMWIHSDHAPVIIGENCWIGRNVSIMKGVTIGDNSVIAAHSVVTKSIPANCIVAGNPAKVVKTDIQNIQPPTSCESFNEYYRNLQIR